MLSSSVWLIILVLIHGFYWTAKIVCVDGIALDNVDSVDDVASRPQQS